MMGGWTASIRAGWRMASHYGATGQGNPPEVTTRPALRARDLNRPPFSRHHARQVVLLTHPLFNLSRLPGHNRRDMLRSFFHRWEHRLASADNNRVVRPFEWGLDWIAADGPGSRDDPATLLRNWSAAALADSDAFFSAPPTSDYRTERPQNGDGNQLTVIFPSALSTPHPENNLVYAEYFPARRTAARKPRRAVVVLPQWNAGTDGHVGLCRLMARFGLSALRLSLPYHDRRMPAELSRADYIVSANVARTVQVCRQAVLDARRAVAWLASEGYERIGILGTSLGSCLAMLTASHEPLIRAQALNHISPYFADVVWEGLSTAHVRAGLNGHIDLDTLRTLWLPISPFSYLDRVRATRTLLVYARYDLSFPVHLSRELVQEFRDRGIQHQVAVLPCGHYSTGVAPFKHLDAAALIGFLRGNL
jgi:dienelactone hydrolase